MKRLLRRVTTAVLVASLALSVFAAPVAAAGDCVKGSVSFYTEADGYGLTVRYCFRLSPNTGDYEMTNYGPATNNLGPLSNGAYRNDFNIFNYRSGLKSLYFYDRPTDTTQVNMCMFEGDGYTGPSAAFIHTTGWYNVPSSFDWGEVASFFWTTSTSSSACG